jgi:hypothetical protein
MCFFDSVSSTATDDDTLYVRNQQFVYFHVGIISKLLRHPLLRF